ncbi:MAG: flavodoxin-dependent (E)-4-hydroxy-3-methylbut-2-enyl-diphosphate synthase [bacterium]
MFSDINLREKTLKIRTGGLEIGGDSPILVETMVKKKTTDVEGVIEQINNVARIGCDIIRIAVLDSSSASVLPEIVQRSILPIVADIHFIPKFALSAIDSGVSGIRLNPGNIKDKGAIREITREAKRKYCHIRVGVNAGSISDEVRNRYGGITSEAMVYSAQTYIDILEDENFIDIITSLKAYDINITLEANLIFAKNYSYPLHIGVTEAGYGVMGVARSSVGLALILRAGIGNTIRVSLTGEPEDEVEVGYEVLRALGLRKRGLEFISCPMCGRCRVDFIRIVRNAYNGLKGIDKNIRVAIMGCEVNGPGEAKEADIGLAFGKRSAILFERGELIGRVEEDMAIKTLINKIGDMI